MRKYGNFLRAAAFFLILLLLLDISSRFCTSVALKDSNKKVLDRVEIEAEFRKEVPNTIDLLVLGDSESFTSISPMQLWSEKGISSFVSWQSLQPLGETLHMLQVFTQRQKPKAVLFEAHSLFEQTAAFRALDQALANQVSVALPVFQFHNVWKLLLQPEKHYVHTYKGAGVRTLVNPYEGDKGYMKDKLINEGIPHINQLLFSVLVRICRMKKIDLIMYSSPSPQNYNEARHLSIQEIADKFGVPFVDLNEKTEEMGINWAEDTMDKGDHLNIFGREKTTAYMAEYLEKYGFEDRRGDPAYQSWNELAEQYKKETAPFYEQLKRS